MGSENPQFTAECAEELFRQLRAAWHFEDIGEIERDTASAFQGVARRVRFPGDDSVKVLQCECPWSVGSHVTRAKVLDAWRSQDLPSVAADSGGFEYAIVRAKRVVVEYLVTDWVSGDSLAEGIGHQESDSIRTAVQFIRPFHTSGATVVGAGRWSDSWFARLETANDELQERRAQLGWSVPCGSLADWRMEIDTMSAGNALLHGDFRTSNLIASPEHQRLTLLNPVGAILGARDWEIGALCANEVEVPQHLPRALAVAYATDRQLCRYGSSVVPLDKAVMTYSAGVHSALRAAACLRDPDVQSTGVRLARAWVRACEWAFAVSRTENSTR